MVELYRISGLFHTIVVYKGALNILDDTDSTGLDSGILINKSKIENVLVNAEDETEALIISSYGKINIPFASKRLALNAVCRINESLNSNEINNNSFEHINQNTERQDYHIYDYSTTNNANLYKPKKHKKAPIIICILLLLCGLRFILPGLLSDTNFSSSNDYASNEKDEEYDASQYINSSIELTESTSGFTFENLSFDFGIERLQNLQILGYKPQDGYNFVNINFIFDNHSSTQAYTFNTSQIDILINGQYFEPIKDEGFYNAIATATGNHFDPYSVDIAPNDSCVRMFCYQLPLNLIYKYDVIVTVNFTDAQNQNYYATKVFNLSGEKTIEYESGTTTQNAETQKTAKDYPENPEIGKGNCAINYVGQTVEQICKKYGNNYSVSTWEGGNNLEFENCDFYFYYSAYNDDMDLTPEADDVIFSVESRTSTAKITSNIKIGDSLEKIEKALGQKIDLNYSEMTGDYVAQIYIGDIECLMYFGENDKVLRWAECRYKK